LAPGELKAEEPLLRLACKLVQKASSAAAEAAKGARVRAAKLSTSRFHLYVTNRWQAFIKFV
jgi:hypothetical protein